MTWCTVKWLCRQGLRPLLVGRLEGQAGLTGRHRQNRKSSLALLKRTTVFFSTNSNNDNEDRSSVSENISENINENIIPLPAERMVGRTQSGQETMYMLKPDSPPDSKVLRVAIIGRPNCGKSTLTNALMGWRVCSVSGKVHTTRKNTMAVYTKGTTQIVFVDTPGILQNSNKRQKHRLPASMEVDPANSLATADLVVAVIDMGLTREHQRLDMKVMQLLYLYRHIPAVLVLNKVDTFKDKSNILIAVNKLTNGVVGGKRLGWLDQYEGRKKKTKKTKKEAMFAAVDKRLGLDTDDTDTDRISTETDRVEVREEDGIDELNANIPEELRVPVEEELRLGMLTRTELMEKVRDADKLLANRKGWPLFKAVFSVSALRNTGVHELKNYLMECSVPAPWPYHSSLVTDQPPSEVVELSIRQALLDNLLNEVPYRLSLDIELIEVDQEDMLNLIVNVNCPTERCLTIFLGRDGEMIRRISSQSKQAIMDTFRCETRLKLIARLVKHRKR